MQFKTHLGINQLMFFIDDLIKQMIFDSNYSVTKVFSHIRPKYDFCEKFRQNGMKSCFGIEAKKTISNSY